MWVRSGNWWNSNSQVTISLLTDIRISIYLTAFDWGCSLLSHFYCRADHPLSFWLLNHFLTSLPKWPRKFIERYLHQNFNFSLSITTLRSHFVVAFLLSRWLPYSLPSILVISSTLHIIAYLTALNNQATSRSEFNPTDIAGGAHSLKKISYFYLIIAEILAIDGSNSYKFLGMCHIFWSSWWIVLKFGMKYSVMKINYCAKFHCDSHTSSQSTMFQAIRKAISHF